MGNVLLLQKGSIDAGEIPRQKLCPHFRGRQPCPPLPVCTSLLLGEKFLPDSKCSISLTLQPGCFGLKS